MSSGDITLDTAKRELKEAMILQHQKTLKIVEKANEVLNGQKTRLERLLAQGELGQREREIIEQYIEKFQMLAAGDNKTKFSDKMENILEEMVNPRSFDNKATRVVRNNSTTVGNQWGRMEENISGLDTKFDYLSIKPKDLPRATTPTGDSQALRTSLVGEELDEFYSLTGINPPENETTFFNREIDALEAQGDGVFVGVEIKTTSPEFYNGSTRMDISRVGKPKDRAQQMAMQTQSLEAHGFTVQSYKFKTDNLITQNDVNKMIEYYYLYTRKRLTVYGRLRPSGSYKDFVHNMPDISELTYTGQHSGIKKLYGME